MREIIDHTSRSGDFTHRLRDSFPFFIIWVSIACEWARALMKLDDDDDDDDSATDLLRPRTSSASPVDAEEGIDGR